MKLFTNDGKPFQANRKFFQITTYKLGSYKEIELLESRLVRVKKKKNKQKKLRRNYLC